MTIEEIRKGAPSGATHYDHEVKKYLKLHGGDLHYWCDNSKDWVELNIIFLDIERCTTI